MDWESRFQDNDTPWERAGLHPALEHWARLGHLSAGRTIMIPGCGRAREPLALADQGLAVTLADLSETAIGWQRQVFAAAAQTAQFIQGDAFGHKADPPYDLIWEQTFLCAISPKQRAQYEETVQAWLKPGGVLLALFMQKGERGGPPYDCPIDAMQTLFPTDRWEWPEASQHLAFPHPTLPALAEIAIPLRRR